MTKQKIILVGNLGRTAEVERPTMSVGDAALSVIEYRGQRVVTLAQIDAIHKRPPGTARRNLSANRSRLIAGEDFVEITANEIRAQSLRAFFPARTPKGVLLTESGYLMLVKSFNDNLAWTVQRQLVTNYFRPRRVPEPAPAIVYSVGKTDKLDRAEQDQLRSTLNAAAQRLPRDAQGVFLRTGWSKLKAHFKVAYRDIPRAEFVEALSMVERHVTGYETPREAARIGIGHAGELHTAIEGFASIANGFAQMMPGLVAVLRRCEWCPGTDGASGTPDGHGSQHCERHRQARALVVPAGYAQPA